MSIHDPVVHAPSERVGLPTIGVDADGRRMDPVALAALGGLTGSGLLLAIAAPRTAALLPESIRPAPTALAGALRWIGVDIHALGAIAVLIALFGCYAVAVSSAARLSARVVVAVIVGLHLLMLLAPPLVSTDVFSYQAYARMGAHYGVNPYLSGPHAIFYDAIFPYVGEKWTYIPSAYGPVFTVLSYALVSLSIAVSVIAYKLIATLSSLALLALVWRCARKRAADPVRAVALVGLNPLLVVYGVGGGHNDLLMVLAMTGGILAILSDRGRAAGGLGALAVSVKLTAGIVLPFALLARRAEGPGAVTPARRYVLGLLGGLAGAVGLSVALFGRGTLRLLTTVVRSQSEGNWNSIPGLITDRLHLPSVGHVATWLLAALFVVVLLRLLRQVWRGALDWIDGAAWATLALLVTSSSLLPWYVVWLLPLAALARDQRLRTATVILSGVVLGIQLLGYIPHGLPIT